MKDLLDLFWAFFKIGICTFGGGYAMLPMLEREIVNHHKWCTTDDILDYFAISQCTPGVIAVNTATFVGYRLNGVSGGVIATLGVIFPSIVIITVIAAVLSNFMEYEIVLHAFAGIRIAVCAMIAGTIVKLAKKSAAKWWQGLLAALGFAVAAFFKVNTIIIVVATIAGAVLCFFLMERRPVRPKREDNAK